jgi:HD superfamily phosphohydrolase
MSQRRSSARTHNRSKAITEGVQNVGTFLSNLASRVASQFTKRNRDHLIVPINSSSPRRSSSSRQKSNRSSIHIIPSSEVISNPEMVTSIINNNNKAKKTSRASFKTSPNEFTGLGIKKQFLQLRKVQSVKKRKRK